MATITATTLQTLLNAPGLDATTCEEIIDTAIDVLNLYSRADLPNMTGTAGSKTVSVDSSEAGAIKLVVRAIYYSFFKGIEPVSLSGLSISPHDVLGSSTTMATVKEAARILSEPDVDVG